MAKKVLTHNLAAPLTGATGANIEIDTGDGNLTVDSLSNGEPFLASGALQYMENQSEPDCSVRTSGGQTSLKISGKGSKQPWLRLPWAACNGATLWQIHLHPGVRTDLTAHSNGGNVHLNLAGMDLSRVKADTGGGNMDVILPDTSAALSVGVKSGAGNVVVHIPRGIAARIHATSGLGKVIVASGYSKVDDSTYQSPEFEVSARKVEITASTGAGNVIVNTL